MDRSRPTNAVRRLESARSATELTTSMLNATLQLVTVAALVGRTLRAFRTRSKRSD
jgi:hypothetical protein